MKKIAVVEDNPDNRLLVKVILEPLYEVVEYETGFAALEGLPKEKPDLVLLDISLPEMDGAEVLRRIRADARLRALPVIALTAHAMAGDREKFLARVLMITSPSPSWTKMFCWTRSKGFCRRSEIMTIHHLIRRPSNAC